ncbi:Exodeoxyribonuclease VII large subunit [Anaerobranca californiensis DSM 14826]|jgi:exodeoxyribonuclease VII large subunit|uniref:Exodeoxyribonuclease 7 large subunit n=1 Tax=Anaerobranca californiensis DSM 14826 TaxID=1120989 RepID=A0A1M6L6I7_9FIRM|nr:exodeoxyribonuclease VII large subunit [Anaerobranca californiensis]SHJ66831.1 Exodeoxyribonuclease VII large subunit [Anaerobranca californiensis DSM 14826]
MFKSPITVSQLTTIIKELLEEEPLLRDIAVKGEISNFKKHNSGHLYFTLKDNQSVIKVVMFKYNTKHLKFMPQDGQQVIITGYVGVYPEGGSYQLYASSLHSIGEGDLTIAFNQLKEKLEKEGLFSETNKRPIPQFPQKIGVVTGDNSAALRDILITLKNRNPLVEVVVATCLVQGAYAKYDIVSKLESLGKRTDIDLIILARGGGSLEDLWPFNEEEVARAIFNCPIPIITGIGHETDFTIADFVADKRAATPTAAAQQAVLDLQELNGQLVIYESSLKNFLRKNLSRQKERLMELNSRLVIQRPLTILNPFYQNLDLLQRDLLNGYNNIINFYKKALLAEENKILSLSPNEVLKRGYAFIKLRNKILKSIKEVEVDEEIEVSLADGKLWCKILEKIEVK